MKETTQQEAKRNSRWLKLLSAEFIITLLVFIAAVWAFVFAVDIVFVTRTSAMDDAVFEAMSGYVSPGLTRFMLFITFLGNHAFLIPANLLLLGYYIFRRNKRLSVRVPAIALSSLFLKLILKNSFQRLRPDVPLLEKVNGFSFPSGHALMAVSFYGLLIYVIAREVKNPFWRVILVALLVLLILLISLSRIYLRVHYTSDVIAGLAVGLIWLLLSLWLIGKLEKKELPASSLPES